MVFRREPDGLNARSAQGSLEKKLSLFPMGPADFREDPDSNLLNLMFLSITKSSREKVSQEVREVAEHKLSPNLLAPPEKRHWFCHFCLKRRRLLRKHGEFWLESQWDNIMPSAFKEKQISPSSYSISPLARSHFGIFGDCKSPPNAPRDWSLHLGSSFRHEHSYFSASLTPHLFSVASCKRTYSFWLLPLFFPPLFVLIVG